MTEQAIAEISERELKSGVPFRLNQILKTLAEELSKVQGFSGPFIFGAGPYTFQGAVTANGGVSITGVTVLTGASNRGGAYEVARIPNISTFANNAAAKAGGLTDGYIYRTANGDLKIVY